MDQQNPVKKGWMSLQTQLRKLKPHRHPALAVNPILPPHPADNCSNDTGNDSGNVLFASPYEALPIPNDGRQYIRLLTILDGHDTNIVSCELDVHLLDQAPPYEALSYYWGNPEPAVQIKCNGIPMSVGTNLGAALRRLQNRHESRNTHIWIDAICINQSMSALAERSLQVSFMKHIYERSVKVLIWLGDGDETTQAAVELIRSAAKYFRDEDGLKEFGDILEVTPEPPDSSLKQSRDLPPPFSADWDAVSKVLDNPWFERVWVLQEASSTVAEVLIGKIQPFPWLELLSAARWLHLKLYTVYTRGSGSSANHAITAQARKYGLPMRLELLLNQSHSWLATNPRDRVYALYGLTRQSTSLNENELTAPDYQKSVVEVFRDLTRYLVMQPYGEWDNGILSVVASSGDNGKDGFPSWVPRFDRAHDTEGGGIITDAGLISSWTWQAGTFISPEIRDSEPSSLTMKGLVVTEVLLSKVFVSEPTLTLPRTQLREIYKIIWGYWKSGNAQDEEVFKGKFARTITAGRAKDLPESDEYPWAASDLDDCFAGPSDDSDIMKSLTFRLRQGHPIIFLDEAMFGLSVAKDIRKGDVVCVLFGQKVPYIIRPCGTHFTFVSDCYVDDFMFSKATDEWEAGRLKEQWIELR